MRRVDGDQRADCAEPSKNFTGGTNRRRTRTIECATLRPAGASAVVRSLEKVTRWIPEADTVAQATTKECP